MLKGILFDMGETLVHNSSLDFHKGLEYLYEVNLNKNIDKEFFINDSYNIINDLINNRNMIEIRSLDFLKLIIEKNRLEFDIPLEKLEVEFALKTTTFEIIEDVVELLDYFKSKGYIMVVLSNTCFSKAAIKCMLGDLNKYFKRIFVSSEYLVRKPNKAFFELGISKFKAINKFDFYYIGNDFYNDVYGAAQAHIYPIWFNKLNNKPITELKVNDYIEITSYKQLIEMDF